MQVTEFTIVKYQSQGNWYFAIKKESLFGTRYVRCLENGDIRLNISSKNKVKLYDTEKAAEEAVLNIVFAKKVWTK